MKSPISARGWWLLAVGVALIPVVLTVAFTMRLPARGLLAPLPGAEALDYLNRPSRLSPLSPRFIEHILGADLVAGQGVGERSTLSPRELRELREAGGRITDVHQLTNDAFRDARVISGIPYTARANTGQASREAVDPSDCAQAGGTVWYRYTPNRDLGLIAYTFGTDHAVSLGAFRGNASGLQNIRCDTDTSGNALVAFPAKAGQTYFFQVSSPLGGGNLVFNLDPQGTISRVSVSSSGEQANRGDIAGGIMPSTISGDGRYVAFISSATNFAEDTDVGRCLTRSPNSVTDEQPCTQAFVHDRVTRMTTLVSISSSGEPGDSNTDAAFISPSGRYIVFESVSSNFFPGDITGSWDVFVHDLLTRRTERVPAFGSNPQETFQMHFRFSMPTISDDGRFVAFQSPSSDLIPGDTNGDWDAFVYDRATGRTERVSVSSSGEQSEPPQPNDHLYNVGPSISADGRFVAFRSMASNLVDGDSNDAVDDFVHDRLTHRTERISVSSAGAQGNDHSYSDNNFPLSRISADGRYVIFASFASNLVAGDTNNAVDNLVRDRYNKTTVRVSVSSSGEQGGPGSLLAARMMSISLDGRYAAFDSTAENLAPGDGDPDMDIFLHDLLTQTTTLITLSPAGEESSGYVPSVSRDGRFVSFSSGASNLVGGDTNGVGDIFVYEAPRLR